VEPRKNAYWMVFFTENFYYKAGGYTAEQLEPVQHIWLSP